MIDREMCVTSLYRLAMAQLAAREFAALPELPLGVEFPTFLERLLLDNHMGTAALPNGALPWTQKQCYSSQVYEKEAQGRLVASLLLPQRRNIPI